LKLIESIERTWSKISS